MPELVTAFSEDDFQLEGLLWQSDRPAPVVVFIHGAASRFYTRTVAQTAEDLWRRGFTTVSGNTRGHDFGALIKHRDGNLVLGGTAWEDLTESSFDVGGWTDWATNALACEQVVLVGHSLGGWKVANFIGTRSDRRVVGAALLSPTIRGTPGWWDEAFRKDAQALIRRGAGAALMEAPVSRWGRVSARAFLSRAPELWPDSLMDMLPRMQIPIHVTYGTEGDIGGIKELAQIAKSGAHVSVTLVQGANHFYTGYWQLMADQLAQWVKTKCLACN